MTRSLISWQRGGGRRRLQAPRVECLEARDLPGFLAPLNMDLGYSPRAMALGHFRGNQLPLDLAVADFYGVNVLLGNGDGTFAPPVHYFTGDNTSSVAVGDVDGDGTLDLVVANYGRSPFYDSGVSVLLGNGDGTFQPARNVFLNPQRPPTSVAVGDFNGDGLLDIAVAGPLRCDYCAPAFVDVLLGHGDGTFQLRDEYYPDGVPDFMVVADFDRDRIPDLAVLTHPYPYTTSEVTVLLDNGDGTFRHGGDYAGTSGWDSLAVGDFRGIGNFDLAVADNDNNSVNVLLGNGDGTFQPARAFPAGPRPNGVAVGDFNGDGKLDLAVANFGSNNVSALLGNGDGTFQPAQSFPAGTYPFALAVGDFNGDGFPDLAVGRYNGVSILLNDTTWPPGAGPASGPGTGLNGRALASVALPAAAPSLPAPAHDSLMAPIAVDPIEPLAAPHLANALFASPTRDDPALTLLEVPFVIPQAQWPTSWQLLLLNDLDLVEQALTTLVWQGP
jgi:hypothetical protein